MSILFYDGVTPHPYTYDDLVVKPMGGTEATVARIMNALEDYYVVGSIQRNGNQDIDFTPKVVITLRDAGHYRSNKIKWPKAKHYLWLHDYVSGDYRTHLYCHLHDDTDTQVITVSEYHKHNFQQQLMDIVVSQKIKVYRIYNPVVTDDVAAKETDRNKLVFFSSPHKGLTYTIELFKMIRRVDPSMTLFIANPGYMRDTNNDNYHENIFNMGSLTHKEMMGVLSNALCLFYPNHTFPETFGLVMAEANALGVPVLTHPLAAANEVLSHPKERMDVRNYKEVVDRVLSWKNGDRPTVKANSNFNLQTVIKEWKKLL